ncbi:hypothetical protein LV457_17810 [Mycobacterium sp. MYCO198283]|uniref:DUF6049 family protein n=1 Tax=Mycobacterium sp. MYCO198283 TaxID=2883505 RepID=UPI001E4FA353|nr:DUF6049 family protein [Mycobacterium sp. MYCO198283]MCG5434132.1 hypothetical protein [Mycobacterium sp. MYCO198283]
MRYGAVTPGPRRRLLAVLRLLAVFALLAVPALAARQPPAAADARTNFLRVQIDAVSPEVVTTGSDPTVTVSGVVRNVGDRTVRDVVVRLEHAAAVDAPGRLRTDLTGSTDQFEPVGDFVTAAAELARGQSAPFRLRYPLRAAQQPALGIERPGVYPLLVNVNGTPEYGAAARLDDGRFLLPVLGVPGDPGAAADEPTAVVAPDTSRPVAMTMLWPLADRPRLAPGQPGGATPIRLVDDELAGSLAAGGRLDALLSAVEFATGPQVDPAGDVRDALCLAVDPDLLVTVNAMTAGYVVTADAADRTAATRPGTGQGAATAWLDRLKVLAKRMCVAPTPYAQADLDALQRVGDRALAGIATNSAGDVVDQLLGITSARGATLLGDSTLTRRGADLLTDQGSTVAIAAAPLAAPDTATGRPGPLDTADLGPRRLSPRLVAAPFDPSLGAALAEMGDRPAVPGYLDSSLAVPLDTSAPARCQDALGAMLWRTLTPSAEPRSEIVMPPSTWSASADDARAVLTALATAIRSGLATARPLPELIAGAEATAGPQQLSDDDTAATRIDGPILDDISAQIRRLWGLTAAMTVDTRTGMTGVQYTAPLREDVLRALSQEVAPPARNAFAADQVAQVRRTIGDLLSSVTIVNPGGSYTLATERSPLPLALRNNLPVPIRVRLQVDAPPGMDVTDIGEQELPPGYLPLRVPVEVHFTQRVAVDIDLRTPDGMQLGEPVRLSVHSNAYGKVLFAITLAASAVLVALAGRRLWHRFRGQPDPADLDRPAPP